ncbi:MAG: transglycosylase SLT domain-containing protein [Chloroflexi bacterium]|nr:transglycosylase SLT domain-containing protein [Chloroflexota bacterium]
MPFHLQEVADYASSRLDSVLGSLAPEMRSSPFTLNGGLSDTTPKGLNGYSFLNAFNNVYRPTAMDLTSSFGSGSLSQNRAPVAAKPAASAPTSAPMVGTGGNPAVRQLSSLIDTASAETGVPADVLAGIIDIESSGNARAESPMNYANGRAIGTAKGLMQLMDSTASRYGVQDPYNPEQSLRGGARYLSDLYKSYGDWDKAAAAYFGAIDAQGNITGATDAAGTSGNSYVTKFRTARQAYSQPTAASGGPSPASQYSVAFGFNKPYGDAQFSADLVNHRGVDLTMNGKPNNGKYEPVRAFQNGVVAAITNDPNGGNGVIVQMPNGLYTRYFHFDAISPNLAVGSPVIAGATMLGTLGESGSPGFAHVHFEVSKGINGDPQNALIDPRPYMGG